MSRNLLESSRIFFRFYEGLGLEKKEEILSYNILIYFSVI